ncbi:MAG: TonB family protein [Terriglobales bacterium]
MSRLAIIDNPRRHDRTEAGDKATRTANSNAAVGAKGPSAHRPPIVDQIAEKARLDGILEEALVAAGATGAAIALIRGPQMVCCATAGPDAPDLGTAIDPGTGLTGCCVRTREIQQCSDTETNRHVDPEACRLLGVRAIVVFPVLDSDHVVGVLEILSSRPGAFDQCDLYGLQILANRILDREQPRSKDEPMVPLNEPAPDPMQAELLAREAFLASAQSDTKKPRSKYWMFFRTLGFIVLPVVLGWILGHAGWQTAVDRADHQISESQISESQKDVPPALPAPPETESETASPSSDSGPDVGPVQVSPEEIKDYVIRRVMPDYPESARQEHVQGRVVLQVSVGADGLVQGVIVASGDPQLGKAAVKAVRQWRFRPRSLQGQATGFETQIVVNFAIT